eukprot:13779526-Alexandrium_andersonii.AAC.1
MDRGPERPHGRRKLWPKIAPNPPWEVGETGKQAQPFFVFYQHRCFVMKKKLLGPLRGGYRPADPRTGASGAPEAPVGG